MDSGLSDRMGRALDEARSRSIVPRDATNEIIDLSTAYNEVPYKELSEFFKTTVDTKLTAKHFAPSGTTDEEPLLRSALSSFFNSHFRPIHQVDPEHIVLTAGAADGLETLVHAICDDGDSVLVPGPYWYGYEPAFKTRPNVNIIVAHPPTYVNFDNYLLASLQAAYDFAADRSRIKAVFLCNPHNPLSRCYPKKAIVECMEFCQEHGLHLVSDELFALMPLDVAPSDAPSFISALSLTEPLVPEGAVKVDPSRVHVVWSASKLFGSHGFRVGCIISQQNPELRRALGLLTATHVNSVSMLYLRSLLTWSQLPTLLKLGSERLTASCRLLLDALQQWNVTFVQPTHGILVFAKLAKNVKSAEEEKTFFQRLAAHGVAVSPGQFYNGVELDYGWARIRFAVSLNDMRMAIAKMSTFLAKEA
ncbi:PLP-dependent transferase [Polyplosphaeria fusca]|uniref:PLP-dependent transferase n=1 Tax=Polyplosphaeria fusca TaxID=682080 RepID=A0A9P4UWV4_9PLEO|nr:PLP-dependent transferase [Polyplosphaeria fusca]